MRRFPAFFGLFFAVILWLIGSIFLWAGVSARKQAAELGQGPTLMSTLKVGDKFRFDTRLTDTNQQVSLHQKLPCVAYQLRVFEVTKTVVRGEDDEEEERLEHHLVLERRKGPPKLTFASPDAKVSLPLEAWQPQAGKRFELDSVDSVDYGKEIPRPGLRFWYHESEEACLESDVHYAVVGQVHEIRDGEVVASKEHPAQVIAGTLAAASQEQGGASKVLLLVGGVLILLGFALGAGLYRLLKGLLGTHSPT